MPEADIVKMSSLDEGMHKSITSSEKTPAIKDDVCTLLVKLSSKNKANYSSRKAQLEQKLDGLVTLLTTCKPKASSPPRQGLSFETALDERLVLPFQPRQSTPQLFADVSVQASAINQFPGLHLPLGSTSYSADPEELLDVFRTQMTPHFPFVVTPPGTTSIQLHQQKPFLYSVIMMSVSYRNLSKQTTMVKDIMIDLGIRLLQRGEKSMDLL